MCGIVGIWNIDGSPINRQEIKTFTDTLIHRGPDGKGEYIDKGANLGLGHRRLSILDLSNIGKQPMSYGNERYWITYNGEIYNFLELRRELESLNYSFKSKSDTEVILASYIQWGKDCQYHFNGMWAFAIWDSQERTLFLSRDRFGVKPLHYYDNGKIFAFASEMKSFLALSRFELAYDQDAITKAIISKSSVEGTEECLLKGVKRLRGGHHLFKTINKKPIINQWWNTLDHLEEVPDNYDDQVDRFKELFFDACKIRMRSDVPIGSALSGGLDSSSVLCAMNEIRSKDLVNSDRLPDEWQNAFVATYPGSLQDESKWADLVIKKTGAIPKYIELNKDMAFESFEDLLYFSEEVGLLHIGPFQIYKQMRENGVVVSIDGHGGDELLAGYPHYPRTAMEEAIFPIPNISKYVENYNIYKGCFSHKINRDKVSFLNIMRSSAHHSFPSLFSFLRKIRMKDNRRSRNIWLNKNPDNWLPINFNYQNQIFNNFDRVSQRLYTDFHQGYLPTILRNFDRLSMANGVEIRAPFLIGVWYVSVLHFH